MSVVLLAVVLAVVFPYQPIKQMCRVATVPGARNVCITEPIMPSSNMYELVFFVVLFLFRLVQV